MRSSAPAATLQQTHEATDLKFTTMTTIMVPVFFSLLFILTAIPPGATENENQNGESVYDIITKANENEPDLSQGDIQENGLSNADPCTATGCMWPKDQDNLVKVPYKIAHHYTREQKGKIKEVLTGFEATTCIRFVKRRKQDDFLRFFRGSGCWSYVGRRGGKQDVSLHVNCLSTAVVQHEILHALGFHHEHSRSDRDDHVNIHLENVQPGAENNFDMRNTNNQGTPYDFDSVMQYGNNAFSINGEATITAKDDPDLEFGYAEKMSVNDIDRINKLYCQM